MLRKNRIVALVAALAATAAMSVAAAPASATLTFPTPNFLQCVAEFQANGACLPVAATFNGWPVTGTLGYPNGAPAQSVTLPSGAGFSGAGEIAIRQTGILGDILGGVFIPPFTAPLTIAGSTQVAGVTITQLGQVEGGLHSTSPLNCPNPVAGTSATCVTLEVPTKVILGYTIVGQGNSAGAKTTSQCQTGEVTLNLSTNLTLLEVVAVGSHFVGTAPIGPITCSGKNGNGRAHQLEEALGGTASYVLNINPPPPA
jgi:hypothetical protein